MDGRVRTKEAVIRSIIAISKKCHSRLVSIASDFSSRAQNQGISRSKRHKKRPKPMDSQELRPEPINSKQLSGN
jgi:hypothetical protein